ncbi:preprotein translocase subunit SecD [Mycoplasmopsis canis]|uniref:protein translocase subunit SecDF n=1 Tax=Mycoplasmopsis canis TaxID=29555 RepID=UPI000624BDA4|nr:preprotein translocase subunit SecD [Mycoplasmopsis canis]AKF41141.1 preprotein translocase subunit SecD [Mycoplasmopsis canis]
MKLLSKIFKLTSWKRLIISALILIAAILSIVFGSVFYLGKNINNSNNYSGGTKIVIGIKSNKKIDSSETLKISKSLSERLKESSGISGIAAEPYSSDKIIITKSGHLNDKDLESLINEVVIKPSFIATTTSLKPLFSNRKFNDNSNLDYDNLYLNTIPFKEEGAEYIERNGFNSIKISLNGIEGETEYSKATEYLLNNSESKEILFWLDLKELRDKAISDYPNDWDQANKDLWNFVHVGNTVYTTKQDGQKVENAFKEKELNIESRYLVFRSTINYVHNGPEVYINSNNLTNSQARALVEKINFSLSDYDLQVLSTKKEYVNENKAFLYAMIATLSVFVILSIIQIVNYGILGAVTSISIALYILLTLIIFTAVRGEYSPATITAILLGMLIQFDSSVIWFEKFKERYLNGDSIKKSFINTLRYNSVRVIDSSFVIFISMLIMFYLSGNEIKNFASLSVFWVIISLFGSLLFLKWITTSLATWSKLENREKLFGINNYDKRFFTSFIQKELNYLKYSKVINILFICLIIISVIVFSIFAGINKDFSSGINTSKDFKNYYVINVYSSDNSAFLFDDLKTQKFMNYVSLQSSLNNQFNHIYAYSINEFKNIKGVTFEVNSINENILNELTKLSNEFSNGILQIENYEIINSSSIYSLKWMMIAISSSLLVIIIYYFIRFGLSFALSFLIIFVIESLIIFIILVLTRIEINNFIFLVIASIFLWSVNEKMIIFSEIKENIKFKYHKQILDKEEIINIANISISRKLKRTIISFISLVIFGIGAIIVSTNINLLNSILLIITLPVLLIFSSYIMINIWTKIYSLSEKRKQKRINNGYWKINKIEEQTFNGINDYI